MIESGSTVTGLPKYSTVGAAPNRSVRGKRTIATIIAITLVQVIELTRSVASTIFSNSRIL